MTDRKSGRLQGCPLSAAAKPCSPNPRQLATLRRIAAPNTPGMTIAAIAVLAAGDIDLSRLMTPDKLGAICTIERGHLDDFLNDPALRDYLQHAVPSIACFEDTDDLERCQAAFRPRVATDA